MVVDRCMTSSSLFGKMEVLHLAKNMRLEMQREMQELEECDYDYPRFLSRVAEGKEKEDEDRRIALPGYINVVEKNKKLIDEVFDRIETEYVDREWLRARSIFATDNQTVNQLNECVGNRVSGHSKA